METIENLNINSNIENKSKVSNKQALLISMLSLICMLVLAILIGVRWETNDDPAIASILSKNSYYCIFVGKILSAFIHFFYQTFPDFHFNWWLGFSVFSVSVGISCIIFVVFRKNTKKTALFLSSIIFVTGWYFAISQMNFTRTAMALSAGGVSLISYALYLNEKKHKIILWLFGLCFMLVGGAIRNQCGYIALGFLAVNGAVFLLQQKKIFRKEWFIKNKMVIILLILTACIVFAASAIDGMLLTSKDQQEKAFQAARSNIRDYAYLYPDYITNSDEYEKYGFSENDWKLFQKWIDGDTSFFTIERLERVGELKAESNILNGIKNVIDKSIPTPLGWLAIIISFLVMIIDFKKNHLSVVFVAVFTMVVFGYLVWLGRINMRVSDSIFWGALTSLWISSDYSVKEERIKQYLPYSICFCLIIWSIFTMSCTNINNQLVPLTKEGSNVEQDAMELFNYIDSYKENVYMSTVLDSGISRSQLLTWKQFPQSYCDNTISIGGWTSRLSALKDRWKAYDIDNPLKALLYNDKVYLYYKTEQPDSANLILNYFREHYSESAQMQIVDQIGSYSIVQYYE